MYETIEYVKKHRKVKLKNYLTHRYEMILIGIENYFDNYTLFLRLKENMNKPNYESNNK
jgi:hypothetical protein